MQTKKPTEKKLLCEIGKQGISKIYWLSVK